MLTNQIFKIKFQYAVQNIEIYDNFETSEKEKLMLSGNGVSKSKNKF